MMKKLMAVILVLSMLLATCPVLASDAELEAAKDLQKYGIMTGDPNGNFRLNDGITRAEFLKMALSAKYAGKSFDPYKTYFDDVPESHWASGYVAAARGSHIVNGYSNMFYPDSEVRPEEAIKIIVCLLDYDYNAMNEGGWPVGYIMAAERIGILEHFNMDNQCATRGEVAVALSATLDIPVCKVDNAVDVSNPYERTWLKINPVILDGKDGREHKTWRMDHELYLKYK